MKVSCICSEVRIEGLETLDYLDNLCQRERFTEQGDAITFETEVKIHFYFLWSDILELTWRRQLGTG